MKWEWLWAFLLVVLIGCWCESEGCLEQEKNALLQLKPFFGHIYDVKYYWPEGKQSKDCCEWERVECNNSTGRVIRLFLNFTGTETDGDRISTYSAYFDWSPNKWHLNASLFLPFEELRNLYLSGNSISGCVDNHGFERLSSKLDKLEILDLTSNHFNDSIFGSLSELSSLKSLYLGQNQFTGSNPSNGIKRLLKLKMLEFLDLRDNILGNNILPYLRNFTSLKSLRLQNCGLKESIDMLESNNMMNLKELYLGQNEISSLGSLFQSKRQLRLIKLEVLGLSYNLFNNSIFSSLAAFPNLKSLFLGGNRLEGPIHIEELNALSNLKVLDLSWSHFNHSILSSLDALRNLEELYLSCVTAGERSIGCNLPLQSLGIFLSLKTLHLDGFTLKGASRTTLSPLHLKNLESLDISYTSLENNFLEKIGAMLSLKSLRLWHCELTGTLHTQGFCELTNLYELYIINSNLTGSLPVCSSNLSSLEVLDLSSNQFSGNISTLNNLTSLKSLNLSSNHFSGNIFPLKSLQSLWVLDLSNNNFEIPSSLGPLSNLSKLKYIYADNNTIYADTEVYSVVPTFQLEEISLSCCGEVVSFPQFLYHQYDLRYVCLSNIYFKGEQFPIWLLENNTHLQTLILANNSLSGKFMLPFLSHMELSYLDISKNSFYDNIPNEIGAKLPSLWLLNMSKNSFGGNIPVSMGDMNQLETLDLSDNKLTGEIPRWRENMSALWTLDLSNNKLSGWIPKSMGNMLRLEEIVMANNHLEGPIPMEFCQLNPNLKLLDLSVNNISGNLPSCFSPLWISQVHLSRNRLQGPLTNAFSNSTNLVTLDLSNNHLIGNIPNWIGRLSQLSYFLLNNNHFEGPIPLQLCKLGHLSLIDLSNNNLSGKIPPCLKISAQNHISQAYVNYVNSSDPFSIEVPIEFRTKNNSYTYKGRVLTFLSGIDFSCNKLTGEIPHQVKNFQNIVVLNLSHNRLTGPIPLAVSDLREIESLDLSYNNLSGKIPSQLVRLYYLSFFSVAYNNLSGSVPQRIAQFATFGESSYQGNPFLCGTPLLNNCSTPGPTLSMSKASTNNGLIDMNSFYAGFVVSYVMVLLAIASVLYINHYWRRVWFDHIEAIFTCCYCFLEDYILPKRFHRGNM